MSEEKVYGVVIIIALGIAALWFIKDSLTSVAMSLMPNKDAPTATQTGTTASGQPIVGSAVKYVNPLICAATGQFCDPNGATNNSDPNSANIVGMFNGDPVYQQDNGYTVTPVGQITTLYCERDPSLQITKVNNIVAKMNKGGSPTIDEAKWARKCEPTLFNMMGNDLRSQVIAANGGV